MQAIPSQHFETSRLNLRPPTENDLPEIHFLRSDKEVNKYIYRAEEPSLENVKKFLKKITKGFEDGININWAICLKKDAKMIGSICLWNFSKDGKVAELGYDLHPDFQQQGIMSEAIQVVLDFGFNKLQFEEIEAYTHFENEASKKLLLKNKFNLVEGKKDEGNANNIIYQLSKKLFNKKVLKQ